MTTERTVKVGVGGYREVSGEGDNIGGGGNIGGLHNIRGLAIPPNPGFHPFLVKISHPPIMAIFFFFFGGGLNYAKYDIINCNSLLTVTLY